MSDELKYIDIIKEIHNLKEDREVAHYLNVKPDTLSQWKGRKKIPYKELVEYSNLHNVSLDYLLLGKEIKSNIENNLLINNNSSYQIDVLNVKASAGAGIENHIVEVIDTIILDKNLFKTPINPNKIKLIQVSGDSMFPTLNDGDFVVIDEAKSHGVDGIYAINLHNQILIKRLKFKLDGTVQIISDNKDYEMEIYNPKETQIPLHIIGLKTLTIQR